MPSKIDYAAVAFSLTGGKPLAFKAKEDGSLVVIAHTGQKFIFSAEQVSVAVDSLKPKAAPTKSPKQSGAGKPNASPAPKKPVPKATAKK